MTFGIFAINVLPAPFMLALQEPSPFGVPSAGESNASFVLMLFQTLLALAFVCGLAYALFRWVLPRLQGVTGAGAGSMVRIVDRVGLDTRKSLYVIEVAGRWLLVASSESGVQLISELDATSAEEAAETIERMRPNFKGASTNATTPREAFADRFARLMSKRK
jgi:flagellar biogenesis protein FliO